MFAAFIPNVHAQLEGHTGIGFTLGRHRRQSSSDLLAGGFGAFQLDTIFITGKVAIVNVKEVAMHYRCPVDTGATRHLGNGC
jgi:hypothetical protein